jgi:uncharacterized protein with GYD domain
MERYVNLIHVTPKGKEEFQKASDFWAQITEIVESFGGKRELAYYVGAPFDFLTVTTYPDRQAALKARLRIEALGITTFEQYPVREWTEFLEAVAA